MDENRVTFRRDPLTPYEARVMQEAGWHRRENSDGSVAYIPQAKYDARAGCPDCGSTGYRNYGVFYRREPRTSDYVPCPTCNATGARALVDKTPNPQGGLVDKSAESQAGGQP